MKKKSTKKRRGAGKGILAFFLFIIAILIVVGGWALKEAFSLKSQAYELKDDVKEYASCLAHNDIEGAEQAIVKTEKDVETVLDTMDMRLWKLTAKLPVVGTEVSSAKTLVVAVGDATDRVMRPVVDFLEEYPLSDLKQGNKINLEMVKPYLQFFREMNGELKTTTEQLSGVDFRFVDSDGKISSYLGLLETASKLMDEADDVLMEPTLAQIERVPLDTLIVDGEADAEAIEDYLQFAEQMLPVLKQVVGTVASQDFSVADKNFRKTLSEASEIVNHSVDMFATPVLEELHEIPVTTLLGDGTDKYGEMLKLVDDLSPTICDYLNYIKGLDWEKLDKSRSAKEYQTAISGVIDILNYADGVIISPLIEFLSENPVDGLKNEEGADYSKAVKYLVYANEHADEIKEFLRRIEAADFSSFDKNGKIRAIQNAVPDMIDLFDTARIDLLNPACEFLETHSVSDLILDEGIDLNGAIVYLDFAVDLMPKAYECRDKLAAIDLSPLNTEKIMGKVLKKVDSLLAMYEQGEKYLPFLRAFIEKNQNAEFVVAAQNSAELRSSGGFPGSIGSITITNGVMEINDFSAVYDNFTESMHLGNYLGARDARLFGASLTVPTWDVSWVADFEKVGHIWTDAYNSKHGEGTNAKGVLSLTPEIVQYLLRAAESEITLSDGSVINGDNATKVLQNDIYVKYYSIGSTGSWKVDGLFSEAATSSYKAVLKNLSLSHISELFQVVEEAIDRRVLMAWFEDEELQSMCKELGMSGGLSQDVEHPEAGVFFSSYSGSKLGWYIDVDIQCGEPRENADGSRSYDVTYSFTNTITQELIDKLGWYVKGQYDGMCQSKITMVAPAGGTIGNFSSSTYVAEGVYNGLEIGCIQLTQIYPGGTLTVHCTITTAPGVDEPLTFYQNPTLTAYR